MKPLLEVTMPVIASGEVKPVKSFTAAGHVEPTCRKDHIAFSWVEFDFHRASSVVSSPHGVDG
jgi:hypothetical protein